MSAEDEGHSTAVVLLRLCILLLQLLAAQNLDLALLGALEPRDNVLEHVLRVLLKLQDMRTNNETSMTSHRGSVDRVQLQGLADGKAEALFSLHILVDSVDLDDILAIVLLFNVVNTKTFSKVLLVGSVGGVVLRE